LSLNSQRPLLLAVADLAYSGGEVYDLICLALEKSGLKVTLEAVALAGVVDTIRRLSPDAVIVGHRPLLDDDAMRQRWEAAGSPMGGDIVRALKSDPELQDTPILMVEGLVDTAEVAQQCGADAYLRLPLDAKELVQAVRGLVASSLNGGS
jgi:CheY-like chemotaxis protein